MVRPTGTSFYTTDMTLSPIQNDIISRLKNADFLRYSEMRSAEVANDLYNYHLKQLISKGIVEKSAQGYALSKNGLRHVADVHHTSDQANRLFKINVIAIVYKDINGQRMILSQIRTANPSYGKVGVMGGTILKGESVPDGARRKLLQETGVSAEFQVVGTERRIMYRDGELFSDVLFPIAVASHSSGEPVETDFGQNLWVPIDEAIANNTSDPYDSINSITTVLEAIKDDTIDSLAMFFNEIEKRN